MRSDLLNTNSGKYTLNESGIITAMKQNVAWSTGATIVSGAMVLPEDCVIV